jgi:hypothetical protein
MLASMMRDGFWWSVEVIQYTNGSNIDMDRAVCRFWHVWWFRSKLRSRNSLGDGLASL